METVPSPSDSDPAAGHRLFCFGLGFSALALARRLKGQGWALAGTTRSPEKATALAAEGIEVFLFDRDRPLADPAAALAGTTHLLISIAPDDLGDPVLDLHGSQLAALGGVRWAGYLSTTGVYGSRDGGWVDEDSELRPSAARSRRRVAAEEAWLRAWRDQALPVHIFRLAGIYGPGRSMLDTVRAGRAKRIDSPGQVFSRIHVEDIATVLQASMAAARPGRVYNVCDDDPASPAEVTAYACGLLGVEPPPLVPLEEAGLSPMGLSFWADNKRVSNRRLHEELAVELAYPGYRTGLDALLAEGY
ncbi:SDR family oxidoreductase [Pelagibius litoralis]|uniref:SDR family oxidoreductase n=1 Tax=Pelagibius litoralis TaxID=374515 RepID=A0A967C7R7_9PROT|nr:SDR family oxidoreductase [Pelagibius litoralis]NIA67942.1 SDR family oxidoreductase [Pelagibius litoralis]